MEGLVHQDKHGGGAVFMWGLGVTLQQDLVAQLQGARDTDHGCCVVGSGDVPFCFEAVFQEVLVV